MNEIIQRLESCSKEFKVKFLIVRRIDGKDHFVDIDNGYSKNIHTVRFFSNVPFVSVTEKVYSVSAYLHLCKLQQACNWHWSGNDWAEI